MSKPRNPHWGSSLDSFLKEAGIQKEVDAEAKRRVRSLMLEEQAQKKGGRHAPAAVNREQKVGPKIKKASVRSRATAQRKAP
jgi:hypothetical protein